MPATLTEPENVQATSDVVKFHISLNVADLESAIAFYEVLLGVPPAKCYPDYAKFEMADPPLVMSLEPGRHALGGALNHLGFRVPSPKALVEMQHRLEAAGISTQREEGVECCYARQTKFWVKDRDQNLWEVYVLEADTDHRGVGSAHAPVGPNRAAKEPIADGGTGPGGHASAGSTTTAAPAVAEVAWEHHLGHPFPPAIPLANGSADRVFLRGTFNEPLAPAEQSRILAETRRVLRAGGRVQVHGLSADAELAGEPHLPGPAAAVRSALTQAQLTELLRSAQFRAIRVTKLSAAPMFRHEGIGLREILAEAIKLDSTPFDLRQTVLYQGPFAQIIDDFGNVFRRAEPKPITTPAVEALRSGPMADSFVFFAPGGEPAVSK